MFVYTRLKLNVDRLLSLVNKNIILACKYNQSHNNKNATSNTFPLIYAPSGLTPEWSCVLQVNTYGGWFTVWKTAKQFTSH